jgi:uncharacterized membrane protein affecting hemolysin expression
VVVVTVRVAVDVSVVVCLTVVDAVSVTVLVFEEGEERPSIAQRAASDKLDPFLHWQVSLNLSSGNLPHNPTRMSEVRLPQS